MVNQIRITDEFCEMVKIDSASYNERNFADWLKNRLTGMGLTVYEDKAGEMLNSGCGNLIARLPGNAEGIPAIMLCAHMDTVEPGRGIEPVVKDGVITSAGDTVLGADDKAGIAAILECIRVLQEKNIQHGDIELVFTVAEECGLQGVKRLDFDKLTARFGYVLDCDGSAGTIITKAPAQYRIKAVIYGKAAHAGISPEEGVNAIVVASRAISKMKLGRIDHQTTANIGIINGGKATNIIPDMVNIEGEARSIDPDTLEKQVAQMCGVLEETAREAGARVEIEKEFLYPHLNLAETDPAVKFAVQAAKKLGREPKLISTGGGSDANIFNGKGIPTANLGIGMNKVHSTEEYITIEDLVLNARYLVEIVQVISANGSEV
ncbi:peptidase T-like protein [Thermincola ferriacetica]|uniref:Peptidase T-like protein n=1 Tax=Thermincola ferriacetica TaxID=281456 RepID=A0A0L6W5M3_9FIRM|nr:M20/M25/M40 family metallo-hydrolase [Thermincola ferriacetica]KNZ70766.1 peptidase T-like protein [Thermincola ferriacetica]